ncbi:multidrug efflux pump subunit AcrA (membrane-fusion protein) [Rhizobium tibeticum]|uniref:hypothetical protein n=1 Tax=Rhizobium tibeticum TaxID=501024 RepID=UPI0027810179|nr:hypothetical protein [Rhizobium tibeticum]MDP9808896.1 multidrug efflux pump subunit AcrA (membrane-fusion protein) [Rhizobium tibeticum]
MVADDRPKLSVTMQGKFAEVLKQRYAVVSAPVPATARTISRWTMIFGAIFLTACSDAPRSVARQTAPTQVSTVEVGPETRQRASGRIAPTVLAEVRPRVTGIVLKRIFQQGSNVKQGNVLY